MLKKNEKKKLTIGLFHVQIDWWGHSQATRQEIDIFFYADFTEWMLQKDICKIFVNRLGPTVK